MPKQIDLCIFCGSNPCSCNQSKTTKPVRQKKALEKSAVPSVAQPSKRAKLEAHAISEEVAQYREALTLLCKSGLVRWEDVEANRKDLNMTSIEADVLIWKLKVKQWKHQMR